LRWLFGACEESSSQLALGLLSVSPSWLFQGDNPTLVLVAVLPMGMCQVSSVVLECKAGDTLTKGEEISYFQFGGSDIVLMFQKDANVTFTAEVDTLYCVGKRIATSPTK